LRGLASGRAKRSGFARATREPWPYIGGQGSEDLWGEGNPNHGTNRLHPHCDRHFSHHPPAQPHPSHVQLRRCWPPRSLELGWGWGLGLAFELLHTRPHSRDFSFVFAHRYLTHLSTLSGFHGAWSRARSPRQRVWRSSLSSSRNRSTWRRVDA